MLKLTNGIIFVLASLLILITLCNAQPATTTIVIDDFSTGTGEIDSFTVNKGTYLCSSSYTCSYSFTSCKNQSSSATLGGRRYPYSSFDIHSGVDYDPTYESEFKVNVKGGINVSNGSMNSTLNLTNTGTASWNYLSYDTHFEFLSTEYCSDLLEFPAFNLKQGGGNYIAFTATINSPAVASIQLFVRDSTFVSGNAVVSSSNFDSDIGQYVIQMNLADDDSDVNFSAIYNLSISASFILLDTVDPNETVSASFAISNVRVVSIGDDGYTTNTSFSPVSSSSSSQSSASSSSSSRSSGSSSSSSQSSRSSGSSNSSGNSSDASSLISSTNNFAVLLFCIFIFFV